MLNSDLDKSSFNLDMDNNYIHYLTIMLLLIHVSNPMHTGVSFATRNR